MQHSSALKRPLPGQRFLVLLVYSQFACTSLWFAGNAVIGDLAKQFSLSLSHVADLVSAVQFGFILGTLCFAIFAVADRFHPSRVFGLCALAGAAANLGLLLAGDFKSLLIFRFFTGFFLAGIYPVGMKIAADHYEQGLGKALGFLVGALVLGTAFPHLLQSLDQSFSWQGVIQATSAFALSGGLLVWRWIGEGPFRQPGTGFHPNRIFQGFRLPAFRAAAAGYFGHMWELYTFWAFVPVMLAYYNQLHPEKPLNVSIYSFAVISSGSLACVAGGFWANRVGSARVAFCALLVSGLCCLFSPWLFLLPNWLFMFYLLVWGLAVVADSPQFSALVAQAAPPAIKGTALTIVNCLGFLITIFSLQTIKLLQPLFPAAKLYWFLILGPAFGLIAMFRLAFPRANA